MAENNKYLNRHSANNNYLKLLHTNYSNSKRDLRVIFRCFLVGSPFSDLPLGGQRRCI